MGFLLANGEGGVVLLEVSEDAPGVPLVAFPVKLQGIARECNGLHEEGVADLVELIEVLDVVEPEVQYLEVGEGGDPREGGEVVVVEVQLLDAVELGRHEVEYADAAVVEVQGSELLLIGVIEQFEAQHE